MNDNKDIATIRTGAAYVRVSTSNQEELSPDAQKRLILDYAKKNNIIISSEDIYLENGISGRKAEKRPMFQKMIAKAKSSEHPYDVILVWKYSRFARNQEESIVYKSMLKRDNVEVVSISEPTIDGPFGSLIERIIEWMDEYYSIRLSGEVLHGMTEKALRGGYQSIPPFGYESAGSGNPPVIVPDQAKVVRLIYSSFLAGSTYNAIARKVNLMGNKTIRQNAFEARTIKYMLENPFYYGKVRWNYTKRGRELKDKSEWIIADGTHEALISEADWLAVQERIKQLSLPFKKRDVSSNKHWLSGLVFCSACGSSLSYNKGGRYPFFQCWKYTKGICQTSHAVVVSKLEQSVVSALRESMLTGDIDFKVIQSVVPEDFSEIEILKEQIKRCEMKEKRIHDAYENGIDTIEEYKTNKLRILSEKKEIETKLNKLLTTSSSITVENPKEKILNSVASIVDMLDDPEISYEMKGAAIRSVVSRITYNKENQSLAFFFYYAIP